MKVLQSNAQVLEARGTLERRNASCLGIELPGRAPLWRRLLGRPTLIPFGDPLKSWDILQTVEFIERHHPRTARVLDVGAYNSEILPSLHRLGFGSLTGIDLNPDVRKMPFQDRIRYEIGDLLHSPFPSCSFDVITAISVIEHGFDPPALLSELSRLLAPGGSFLASFDYWPEKIDTTGQLFFGLDWRIFSKEEIQAFVAQAEAYGFACDEPLSFEASERPVHCADRDYTFGWMALTKH